MDGVDENEEGTRSSSHYVSVDHEVDNGSYSVDSNEYAESDAFRKGPSEDPILLDNVYQLEETVEGPLDDGEVLEKNSKSESIAGISESDSALEMSEQQNISMEGEGGSNEGSSGKIVDASSTHDVLGFPVNLGDEDDGEEVDRRRAAYGAHFGYMEELERKQSDSVLSAEQQQLAEDRERLTSQEEVASAMEGSMGRAALEGVVLSGGLPRVLRRKYWLQMCKVEGSCSVRYSRLSRGVINL